MLVERASERVERSWTNGDTGRFISERGEVGFF